MRVKITRTIIADLVKVYGLEETEDFDFADAQDSILDDINDSMAVGFETSDGKFNYTPREVVEVKVEKISE